MKPHVACHVIASRDGSLDRSLVLEAKKVSVALHAAGLPPGTRRRRGFGVAGATAIEAPARGRGEKHCVPLAGRGPLMAKELAVARSLQRHGPRFRADTGPPRPRRPPGLGDDA